MKQSAKKTKAWILSFCVAILWCSTSSKVSAYSPLSSSRLQRTTTLLSAKKATKTKKQPLGRSVGGFGKTAVLDQAEDTAVFTPVRNTGPKYTFHEGAENCIQSYLTPGLFEDPETLKEINAKLEQGEIVVIRNAFQEDFANAMHRELLSTSTWARNENYLDDGYHYRHYNVYNRGSYSQFYNDTLSMFDSDQTKSFMADLTGRDCSGDAVGSPSYYGSGDHSLPHTDHFGQRTTAYVWHLSKNWRPEWGGGLYWAQEPLANAYLHASFNTLVLFSVTPLSSHFVTTVSPHATEERLSFNGWWQSSWEPTLNDNEVTTTKVGSDGELETSSELVPLEDMMDTAEKRLKLTYSQYVAIENLLHDPWSPRVEPAERRELLENYFQQHTLESYPKQRSPPVVL